MKPSSIFYPWQKIHRDTIKVVELFNEDELDFVPFPDSWPVGQIMLHIVEAEDYWVHAVVRKEFPLDLDYKFNDYPSMYAIKMKLKSSHELTVAFIEGLKEPDLDWQFKTPQGGSLSLYEILWHVIEHEIHHRGELSLALGLLGRKGLDV